MKSFKDEQGRTWTPRITTLVVDRYEAVSGRSLLDAVYNFVGDLLEGKNADEIAALQSGKQLQLPVAKVVEFFRGVVGRFGDIPRLMFESIRWDREGNLSNVSYEDFANSMTGDCLEEATLALYEALADFFQKALGKRLQGLGVSLLKEAARGAGETSSD